MRILDLALKDLRQLIRDWKSAVFLLAMPIGFTILLGFVFSGGGNQEGARLPVGYVDLDHGVVSTDLLEMLNASNAIRPVVLDNADLAKVEQQITDGELAAVVIMPAGYSAQVLSLTGESTVRPRFVLDTASSVGQTAQNGVQAALVRLLGAAQTARLTAQAYQAQGGTADSEILEETFTRAIEAWSNPPITVTSSGSGIVAAKEGEAKAETNPYAHSSAGVMVQFAMAGIMGAAAIVVLERKSGALRRLLTTSISRLEIILGHFLAMFLIMLAQLVILVVFGQLAFGVDYFRAPVGTLLMIVLTAFWSASLGLLIGIVAKTEEQVIMFTLIPMLLLAGLGGAWMPLEFTGKTFQAVGHLTPVAWAVDGFENIVVRGLGLESVLVPAAILLAYGLAFLAIGVWQFRFE
jgi:ABC-2 type transport system permease protein